MRINRKKMTAFLLAGLCCFILGGCAEHEKEKTASVFADTDVTDSEPENEDRYFDYTESDYVKIQFTNDGAESEDRSVLISKNSVTITKEGVYLLEGNFKGTLNIETDSKATIWLVFNNVSVEATDGPAVYEKKAGKVVVMLPKGTVNSLEDAQKYDDKSDDAPNGTLFCEDDLTINGTGSLTVYGNYNDGIVSKDDLKIVSGNIEVEACDDGIRGRDSITVYGGTISIDAGGHALKTTNDEKDTKGCIQILGGNFKLKADTDGMNSVNTIEIDNADIEISAKDDGIHADKEITINSGKINIKESEEGLEAVLITINAGEISIVSKDDGISANGGSDPFAFSGFWGNSYSVEKKNSSEEPDVNPCLTINGGEIWVDAGGDGIDSNGDIVMNGGYAFVSGSYGNGDNATDYQNSFYMNGGFIIACGSSGMYQSISQDSKCFAIDYISASYISEGTSATLIGVAEEICDFTITKRANAILIAGESLENGKEYTLVIGNETFTVIASEGLSGNFGGFGGGPGGFGGWGGRKP